MPTQCCAYGCTNSNSKQRCIDAGISYHGFPLNNEPLLKLWLINIRRANFVPKNSSKICSEHFEEQCFKYQTFTNRRMLKKNAVPTKFSFSPIVKFKFSTISLFELDNEDDDACSDCGCVECYRKKNKVINLQKMELPQYDIKKGLWLKSITPLKLLQKESAFIQDTYEAGNQTSEMEENTDSNSELNFPFQTNEDEALKRATPEETEMWMPSAKEDTIVKAHDQQTSISKDLKMNEDELNPDRTNDRLKYFIFPSSSNSSVSSSSSDTNCVSHGDALKAVETLLRYMENQEDVSNADLILIGSYQKKIIENLKKETGCIS